MAKRARTPEEIQREQLEGQLGPVREFLDKRKDGDPSGTPKTPRRDVRGTTKGPDRGTKRYMPVQVKRTFSLGQDTLDRLLSYCERTGQLPSHTIRRAIEEFLERHDR